MGPFSSIQIFWQSLQHVKIAKSTNIWAAKKFNNLLKSSWKGLINGKIFAKKGIETNTIEKSKILKQSTECGKSMKDF